MDEFDLINWLNVSEPEKLTTSCYTNFKRERCKYLTHGLVQNSTVYRFFLSWSSGFICLVKGHKQWVAEVQFLGVLDHPNLVKLLGYCAVDGERGIQRLLVYEYMQNKSLEDHIFNRAVPSIPWIRRLNIILGAAQGMQYLHEGLEIQVHS